MNAPAIGALLGLSAGVGLLLLLVRLRANAQPSLAERISPYVTGTYAVTVHPAHADSAVAALLDAIRPVISGSARRSDLLVRLARAGRAGDVQRFRMERVIAGGLGVAVTMLIGVVITGQQVPFVGLVVLAVIGGVTGAMLMDRHLTQQGRQRARRIGQQLPTVAELLAFSVAAGESPMMAIERVAECMDGDLADEIRTCVADLRDGQPFHDALRMLADRCAVPEVERFVDGLAVSIERGTPLVDVLRAQAADCRATERRRLMELAGRKDVLMLIPVVFFILPTVVLVALFPGAVSLQFLVP